MPEPVSEKERRYEERAGHAEQPTLLSQPSSHDGTLCESYSAEFRGEKKFFSAYKTGDMV